MNITFTLEAVLNGGYHADIGVVVDGGPKAIIRVTVEDLLSQTPADRRAAAVTILATKIDGLTRQQAAAVFPFTVTL